VIPTPGQLNTNQTNADISLPVELSSFRAVGSDRKVTLIWITEAEMDNLGFILERSYQKLGTYEQIATYQSLPSLVGAGNSSQKKRYTFTDLSVFNGIEYWYRLIDVSVHGAKTFHSPVSAIPHTDEQPIEVIPEQQTIATFHLKQNYPNPFNPETAIGYRLSAVSDVELSIYNLLGQKVVTLVNGIKQAGRYMAEWDGTDYRGDHVAGGIYIYRLQSGQYSESKKMILLR
jgi:hypothetical protein